MVRRLSSLCPRAQGAIELPPLRRTLAREVATVVSVRLPARRKKITRRNHNLTTPGHYRFGPAMLAGSEPAFRHT